jgi:hypothetical protein
MPKEKMVWDKRLRFWINTWNIKITYGICLKFTYYNVFFEQHGIQTLHLLNQILNWRWRPKVWQLVKILLENKVYIKDFNLLINQFISNADETEPYFSISRFSFHKLCANIRCRNCKTFKSTTITYNYS